MYDVIDGGCPQHGHLTQLTRPQTGRRSRRQPWFTGFCQWSEPWCSILMNKFSADCLSVIFCLSITWNDLNAALKRCCFYSTVCGRAGPGSLLHIQELNAPPPPSICSWIRSKYFDEDCQESNWGLLCYKYTVCVCACVLLWASVLICVTGQSMIYY